jgi:hypothetical protein
MKRWLEIVSLVVLVGVGLAVGMVWGRSPSLVAWDRVRAVCIESDDWGLCGFVPDSSAIVALDRRALDPEIVAAGSFPPVYWHSTLEDSADVARLCAVLAAHRGRDGLPAVMQPNYILGAWQYDVAGGRPDSTTAESDRVIAAMAGRWTATSHPETPAGYERPGLWSAVRAGRLAGVWHPELHGRWHYDPLRRQEETARSSAVQRAASHQILVFPGSEQAWELGPWRPRDVLRQELDESLATFQQLFSGPPRSVIAPDYVWDDADEEMWIARDLRVIQGQRQQRKAHWRGREGRVRKVIHRTLTRWWNRDRVYLDRNCIFEPVQQASPQSITAAAVAGVRAAWRRGEPAVLEAHRINFVHLDRSVPELGRRELAVLLGELDDDAVLYLTDAEVADLNRRGTSWAVRGSQLVVRNYTHTRRVVVVPAIAREVVARLRGRDPGDLRPLVVHLDPGETRIIGGAI